MIIRYLICKRKLREISKTNPELSDHQNSSGCEYYSSNQVCPLKNAELIAAQEEYREVASRLRHLLGTRISSRILGPRL